MEEEVKKKGSSRNRSAGHAFEKTTAIALREAGFVHVVTSRAENRTRDNEGIDLINHDELKNGRLPYNIQCKNSISKIDYCGILGNMPQDTDATNVILHKFTEKRGKSGFHPKGHYAILGMDDFVKLISKLEDNRKYIDALLNQLNNENTD